MRIFRFYPEGNIFGECEIDLKQVQVTVYTGHLNFNICLHEIHLNRNKRIAPRFKFSLVPTLNDSIISIVLVVCF
jgi:hypothetical protein